MQSKIFLVLLAKIFDMDSLDTLKLQFETFLEQQIPDKNPENLYAPLKYVLRNGGKRIRPLLVLLSAKSFGTITDKALSAAAAIETFHNFTLIHDDIMDKAPIRRGQPTVHEKWDENLAILSGDTMLMWAYKMLEQYDGKTYKALTTLLNQTAIEVCEGQQMDMDFEQRNDVSLTEYLEMIRLKTAVLLGAALSFGGIVANADEKNLSNISRFGINLGIAFQIQDDYLDTYGNVSNFGKQIGGDIIDRKKTFLYISALQTADAKDKNNLLDLYENKQIDNAELIDKTIAVFDKYDVQTIAKQQIDNYTQKSLDYLNATDFTDKEKVFWKNFALQLMHREY
jgi:geranylgeranyl diphosphate synthase type II